MKKHVYDLQKQLSSVKYDLKLIKLRAVFKAFIELFFRGLSLSELLKWDKKVDKIWMSTPSGTMYPPFAIPEDKRYLAGFAWFDYIRPKDKDDIFEWRGKSKEQQLQKTEPKAVPKQHLDDLQTIKE